MATVCLVTYDYVTRMLRNVILNKSLRFFFEKITTVDIAVSIFHGSRFTKKKSPRTTVFKISGNCLILKGCKKDFLGKNLNFYSKLLKTI